jgi:hypothetical protein
LFSFNKYKIELNIYLLNNLNNGAPCSKEIR